MGSLNTKLGKKATEIDMPLSPVINKVNESPFEQHQRLPQLAKISKKLHLESWIHVEMEDDRGSVYNPDDDKFDELEIHSFNTNSTAKPALFGEMIGTEKVERVASNSECHEIFRTESSTEAEETGLPYTSDLDSPNTRSKLTTETSETPRSFGNWVPVINKVGNGPSSAVLAARAADILDSFRSPGKSSKYEKIEED